MKAYYEITIKSYFRAYINQTRDIGGALDILQRLYQNFSEKDQLFIEVISQKQHKCKVRVVHEIEHNDAAYAFVQNLYLGTNITDNFSVKYKLKFFKTGTKSRRH